LATLGDSVEESSRAATNNRYNAVYDEECEEYVTSDHDMDYSLMIPSLKANVSPPLGHWDSNSTLGSRALS